MLSCFKSSLCEWEVGIVRCTNDNQINFFICDDLLEGSVDLDRDTETVVKSASLRCRIPFKYRMQGEVLGQAKNERDVEREAREASAKNTSADWLRHGGGDVMQHKNDVHSL